LLAGFARSSLAPLGTVAATRRRPSARCARLVELKSRVDVIRHVFDTRFLPSIPEAGFCKETGDC
jgi:hypothetical protein